MAAPSRSSSASPATNAGAMGRAAWPSALRDAFPGGERAENMYAGSVMVLDLSAGEVEERRLEEVLVASRAGGAALNLTLFEEFHGSDPIVLGSGLLTGSMVPGSALSVATARSPITGKVMHCPLVSHLGTELKLAGFPFLVLHGRCPRPSYIWMHDEMLDLLPADGLWGKDTWATADLVREEQGDERIQVLSIGPAGERGGSGAAAIVNYWPEGDRIGLGGRLGGMNLKAIAARGMGELRVADPEGAWDVCMRMTEDARVRLSGARGLVSLLPGVAPGDLAAIEHRDVACSGCPWPCRTFVKYNEPREVMGAGVREPGTLLADAPGYYALLGSGLSAIDAARLMERCSRLGLEPMAASQGLEGAELATAMERLLERSQGRFDAPSLARVDGAVGHRTFSAFAPNGGVPEEIALAYILGLCPRYVARMGMDLGLHLEAVEAMSGIRFEEQGLLRLANSIMR